MLTSKIREKLEDFVGREYVFDKINDFVSGSKGYFILLGDPGEGKSTLAGEYVRRNPECLSYFNDRNEGHNTASGFNAEICKEINRRFDLGREMPIADRDLDSGTLLRTLLEEASPQLESSNQKLLIVVDALDEVDMAAQRSPRPLYLPRALPKNIFFIITTRRVTEKYEALRFEQPSQFYDLYEDKQKCEDDTVSYIWLVLGEGKYSKSNTPHRWSRGIHAWIDKQVNLSDIDYFINTMKEKSDRNFMYLSLVLEELANPNGMFQNSDLRGLPHRLKGYYAEHWENMGMNDINRSPIKVDIIQLYRNVLRSASPSEMLEYVQKRHPRITQSDVNLVIRQWGQFLRPEIIGGQKCYRFYHASYLDFLNEALDNKEDVFSGLIGDSLFEAAGYVDKGDDF